MVVIVPFDGTELAKTALLHADHSSEMYADAVIAVAVIPKENEKYAREHGWIGDGEPFDKETIVKRLRREVCAITEDANFEYLTVPRYSSSGAISSQIRRFAKNQDASAVFIGSGNAGNMVIGMDSVGGRVASDSDYDVAIFREPLPEIEEGS
jgi:nucleotide-binding universal stress UspA family protein